MAEWFNTSSAAVAEWKLFVTRFEQDKMKDGIRSEHISFAIEPWLLPQLKNIQYFLSNVGLILNQVKSYNNQMTEFLKSNIPLFIKQTIRMILQVPEDKDTQQRKNKFPLQSLQFIEGLMYLPNIFNINILKEDLYLFYCKAIFYYFKKNIDETNSKKEEYQDALYKNYFFRLFQLPYAVVECEMRTGANYSSISMSVASSSSTAAVIKKQSFLQCLISYLQQQPQLLQLLISNISCQSMLNCLNKIVMTNGLYNYPFTIKQHIIRRLFDHKKTYILMLSNFMNSKLPEKQFYSMKQEMEFQMENVLQLEFNVVNRAGNIYDGIKLFELVGNVDNVKDVVYLASVNLVWMNKSHHNHSLVPGFIEEHLTELLLAIIHRDTMLYKSSSPTIQLQPKISLKDINISIQPLLLLLKQLLSQKTQKVQIKHLNLIKILYIMVLNRQKYDIVDAFIIKHKMFCLLVEICKKFHYMDILVNSVMELFKSIFKSELNIIIYPPNTPNLQQIKNANDLIQEKIAAEAFNAADIILNQIKAMKSHKDPLFSQFFKLSKTIKQFARNFFCTIQTSTSLDINSSSSIQIQNSVNITLLLQPLYRNQYVKGKCKEWQEFYVANFAQLENNYLRDLGKFEEFEKLPPQPETQYSVVRFCEQKSLTTSQVIHDKAEVQATIKDSMQILSLKKHEEAQKAESNLACSNFKKDKSNVTKDQSISLGLKTTSLKPSPVQLISKEQIEIASQPIKIEFKKKRTENVEQNDSSNEETSTQEGQETFKKFMKKRLEQMTAQNLQNRKKSKTPTKFKSSDNKTPPKMKKWGLNQPQQAPKNIPKQLSSHQKQRSLSQKSSQSKNHSLDQKFQKIKKRISQKRPLPIKLILVGKKVPKTYKQREVQANGRDSRLMAWIRG